MKETYKHLFGLPKEEWEALLPGMCEGDEELQSYLKCLLNMPPGFLEREAPRPYSCTEVSLSPNEILAGRWQIVEFLGSGGMADVYAAYDKELDRRVALKVIRSDVSFENSLLDRFKNEVELARQVRHRSVCAVYDIGRDHRGSRDLVFLTMELIPGQTMADRLHHLGPLDPSEWFPVAKQLCKAIQEAHRAKVLHRDFKPGNVMLVGSGKDIRAIVTDFGIARAIGVEKNSSLGLTARSMILGTWSYMSPEQKRGEELAETSDIYSLGLVLYEMITGLQYCQFPKIENIPDEGNWRGAIRRCLEDEPTKRFGTTLELLDALRKASNPREGIELLPPFFRPFAQRLRIAATIVFLLIPVVIVPWRPLATSVANAWNRIFLPLPHEMRVAMIAPQANGEKKIEALVSGWLETAGQKLNDLQDPHLRIIPLHDTINITEREITASARTSNFNLYIMCVIDKKDNQIQFDLRLKEVSTDRLLRSAKFSIPAHDNGSALPQSIATLVERQVSLGSDDFPSQDPQALGFFKLGQGYLLHRDLPNIAYAIESFENAVKQDPQYADAYAHLAFAHSLKYRKTHDPTSIAGFSLAQGSLSGLKHDLPLAHLAAGLMSQTNGNLTGAIDQFQQALRLRSSNHEVRGLLSIAYFESGKIDEAKQLLDEAIKMDESAWFNHVDLGSIYYWAGELDNAKKEFYRAHQLEPDNSTANADLAGICICFGEYDEAERISNNTLASRKSAMADADLARVYEQKGRYAKAIVLLQDAAEQRPMVDKYWLELGDAYKLQNLRPEAAQAFRKALAIAEDDLKSRPKDSDLLVKAALYNAKLGSKEIALSQLRHAEKAVTGKKSADFLINSARVYELTDKRTEALNVLRSALPNKCARSDAEITPDFASLRSDRRYKEIVNQISLR